jgi:hypothetical protein
LIALEHWARALLLVVGRSGIEPLPTVPPGPG